MRQLARNAGALYGAQVINAVLSIAFVPVALARLGRDGYGVYGIYAVLAVYLGFAELGLGKNLLRLLARHGDERARADDIRLAVTGYALVGAGLLLLVPALGAALARWIFPVPAAQVAAVRWIAALAVAEYVAGIPVALHLTHAMALERFDRYSRFQFASGLARYGLAFGALLLWRDPVVVVAAIAARRVVEYLLAPWLLGRLPPGAARPSGDWAAVRGMFGQAATLSLAQVLQMTVLSAGALLVNRVFGLAALGTYRAVYDLSSRILLFSNVLGLVLFPRFVRLLGDAERRARLAQVLPRGLRISWAVYAAVAVTFALAGPWLLGLLGLRGPDYAGLAILMFAGMAYAAHGSVPYEMITATGRYWISAALMGGALALVVALFAALAPSQALLAVGWAWLGSQVAYAFATDLAALGQLGVARAGDVVLRLLLAAVVGGAVAARLA